MMGFPFLSSPFTNLILFVSLELHVCAWEASIPVPQLFAWNILEYNHFMVVSHTQLYLAYKITLYVGC
jgi:hypothetical protein